MAHGLEGGILYGTVGTEVVGAPLSVEQGAVVDVVGVGSVHEAVAADLVVTHHAVGGTQLTERHHPGGRLEERLVTEHPAHAHGGESAEAAVFVEVLRPVVTDVELCHVAVVPVVGHAPHKAHIAHGDGRIGAGIEHLALVVEQEGTHVMKPEVAVVIEARVHIPVAAAARIRGVAHHIVGSHHLVAYLRYTLGIGAQNHRGVGGQPLCTIFIIGERAVVGAFELEGEPLGNEVELLVEYHIHAERVGCALGDARSVVAHARGSHERQRVFSSVVGAGGDIFAIHDAGTGKWRGVVERLKETRGPLRPLRIGLVGHHAAEVERQQGGLGHVEVEVGAVVEAVVAVVVVVGHVVGLEHAVLRVGTGRDEVAGRLRAARDIHVVLALQSRLVQHEVYPVEVGIENGVAVRPELLQYRVVEGGCKLLSGRRGGEIVEVAAVAEGGILVGVGQFQCLRGLHHTPVGGERDLGLALLSALGGDEYHAVGTAHTIDGRGRSILEHGDALYLVGIKVVERAFHTVYLQQR